MDGKRRARCRRARERLVNTAVDEPMITTDCGWVEVKTYLTLSIRYLTLSCLSTLPSRLRISWLTIEDNHKM